MPSVTTRTFSRGHIALIRRRITREVIYIKPVGVSICKCLITTKTPENTIEVSGAFTIHRSTVSVTVTETESHRCVGSSNTTTGVAISHVIFLMW